MEPFSLMFGFICLIGGGAAGWGLNNKLLNPSRQSSMIESVEESKRIDDLMQQNFSQINEKLTKLSINMEYIKKSDIKMEAVFMANEALQGNADLIDALEKLAQFIPENADETYLPQIDSTISSLAEMLFEAISDLGEISPNTARKAGLLALSSGRTHRAKSLFESAYELAPGHSTT
ncbi:MAG: hypothetical protein ACPHK2_00050, partial [Candidatus Poseidoniaceae archaeon]